MSGWGNRFPCFFFKSFTLPGHTLVKNQQRPTGYPLRFLECRSIIAKKEIINLFTKLMSVTQERTNSGINVDSMLSTYFVQTNFSFQLIDVF